MMGHEAIANNTSPYEDVHIEQLMDTPEFKSLTEDVRVLTEKIYELAKYRSTGIESKLPWPPELLPYAARLRAGETGNIRFQTPFAFLIHLEEYIVAERRKPKQ
jgi:hypothetical protein